MLVSISLKCFPRRTSSGSRTLRIIVIRANSDSWLWIASAGSPRTIMAQRLIAPPGIGMPFRVQAALHDKVLHLIHTGLQAGARREATAENRFNGFSCVRYGNC